MIDDGTQREFDTGATRSSQKGRIDPEGFLSPLSIERYCEYLLKHQVQADGNVRESDNWQKGMPRSSSIKGMWRHFLHFWQRHRGWPVNDPKAAANIEEDLCAIIFNAQTYLHEVLREQAEARLKDENPPGFYRHDAKLLRTRKENFEILPCGDPECGCATLTQKN